MGDVAGRERPVVPPNILPAGLIIKLTLCTCVMPVPVARIE
jgi:hypothetical protein